MSGLLALLDDVAGIAKVAAASVDDIAAQAVKASTKAAGVIIDDAAVTPKYVTGLAPARELPIIWKITRGSIFNKLVILLPAALLLSEFLPWVIMPLLMIGGLYLCYEGAEKVLHWVAPHHDPHPEDHDAGTDPVHLEESRVRGAIKTDFILSAEIMTIILNELPPDGSLLFRGAALALAGLLITAAVYGAVALIVKMDDVGLRLTERDSVLSKRVGLALVQGMPKFLKLLSVVGTIAMLWVGGAIVLHALEVTHWWAAPYEFVKAAGKAASEMVSVAPGFVGWAVQAFLDGIAGLALGLGLIFALDKLVWPTWETLKRQTGNKG